MYELRKKLNDDSYLPSREEIFKAFKPHSFEWYNFRYDEKNPRFEILNKEFIDSFTDYLKQEIEEFGASEKTPITILEVGAGNGRLSYFLQKSLNKKKLSGKVKVIAKEALKKKREEKRKRRISANFSLNSFYQRAKLCTTLQIFILRG